MADVPTYEPTTIIAGDTLRWTRELGDYPASAWTLIYLLLPIAGGAAIEIESAADGDTHSVNVAASVTAEYAAGEYNLVAYVTDASLARFSQPQLSKRITVLPDPASATAADQRTDAEKTLSLLRTAYDALVSKSVTSTTISGNVYTLRSLDELQRQIKHWTSVVLAEKQARNAGSDRIFIRFQ